MAAMKIGGMYDFSVYAPQELGSNWRRVEVESSMTYNTAIRLDGDIVATHRALIATGKLPQLTPTDPKQLSYYRVRRYDGTYQVLAEAWIVVDSIIPVQEGPAYIMLPRVTSEDLNRVQLMLSQAGIEDAEIRFDPNFGT